jgi:hypothetical protein
MRLPDNSKTGSDSTDNLLRQIRFHNKQNAAKLTNHRKIQPRLNRDLVMNVSKTELQEAADKQLRNKNTRRNPSITPPKSNRESHKICRGLKSQVNTKLVMGKDNIQHG